MKARTPYSRRAVGAVIHDGYFWIYGGFGVTGTVNPWDIGADLWRFGGDCWEMMNPEGPYPARYPSLCPGDGGFFMFGGCGYDGSGLTFMNELWFYDGRWHEVKPREGSKIPRGRYTAALAMKGDSLFVFGGHSQSRSGDKTYFGDLWMFDLHSSTWQMVHGDQGGPGARYGFGWTMDSDGLFIFGGYDGIQDLGDLWRFDLNGLRWERLAESGPPCRYCPALGIVSNGIVLFGGRSKVNPRQNFSDTWAFNGDWRLFDQEEGLSPGYHAKSGYASDGNGMWIFGGEGPQGHLSDLWLYRDGHWNEVHGRRKDDPSLW
ncbi:MAG: hypothetical protein JRJ77_12815 [Deltaproteobacteria bacterium]|nr:hypothetical protein [Deltaproteobacteria bacterium]MBW2149452.1 hypothetical protein [Deltaproteobacteria bacterium]